MRVQWGRGEKVFAGARMGGFVAVKGNKEALSHARDFAAFLPSIVPSSKVHFSSLTCTQEVERSRHFRKLEKACSSFTSPFQGSDASIRVLCGPPSVSLEGLRMTVRLDMPSSAAKGCVLLFCLLVLLLLSFLLLRSRRETRLPEFSGTSLLHPSSSSRLASASPPPVW